jgi:hypothetical protein
MKSLNVKIQIRLQIILDAAIASDQTIWPKTVGKEFQENTPFQQQILKQVYFDD